MLPGMTTQLCMRHHYAVVSENSLVISIVSLKYHPVVYFHRICMPNLSNSAILHSVPLSLFIHLTVIEPMQSVCKLAKLISSKQRSNSKQRVPRVSDFFTGGDLQMSGRQLATL